MESIKFNKCQTSLEDLHLDNYPQEVVDQFWDFLNNVPFIKWMVSVDRPLVSELPRDKNGRAIIDISHPPILEGSDFFRPSAKAFKKNKGKYTTLRPNANLIVTLANGYMKREKEDGKDIVILKQACG